MSLNEFVALEELCSFIEGKDWSVVKEPDTEDEYLNLHWFSRWTLELKWAYETSLKTGKDIMDVLIELLMLRANNPQYKYKYHLINKLTGAVQVFDLDELQFPRAEINYLVQYGHKPLKKEPRYASWHTYNIEKMLYVAKGNEYHPLIAK